MTKPIPLQYGHYYHIYNRGTNGENIFIEERNYHHFLRLYTRYISPIADTFAYCLLRNHFHLSVRIKTLDELVAQLKAAMKPTMKTIKMLTPSQHFSNFFNAYAKAINAAYGLNVDLVCCVGQMEVLE